MLNRHLAACMFLVGLMLLGTGGVFGQNYPNKTLRIITSPPGGGSDLVSRMISPGLSDRLGQPVIVDNRPAGIIPAETVAKSPPDGYTLFVVADILWITPLLKKTPYDPVRDFTPITLAVRSPMVLAVHPSLPVKSVKELIALAKSRPGELNYAAGAVGSSLHLSGELFKAMAGVNIVAVPYKGGGPSVLGVLGGHVEMIAAPSSIVMRYVRSGKLRGLAVGSAQRSVLVPDLPTVAAAGVPGYEAASAIGVLAPGKTPAAIVNLLNREIVRLLQGADFKEKFLKAGMDTVGSSPEALAAVIKSDMSRMGKLIEDAGIQVK